MTGFVRCSTLSALGEAPGKFRLFRDGKNDARWDGGDNETFILDAKGAAQIIASFESAGKDMVVDFEHQSEPGRVASGPIPAAGWIRGMQWVEGDGLYVEVDWTEQAASMIGSKQYRYFSPVFVADEKTKRILRLFSVALTNRPALNNIMPLAASANRYGVPAEIIDALGLTADASIDEVLQTLTEIKAMAESGNKTDKKIEMSASALASLNIDDNSTPEVVTERIGKIVAANAAFMESLGVAADADANAIKAAVEKIKASSVDPSKFTPNEVVAELSASVKKLHDENTAIRCGAFIEGGMKAGKIVATTREMWERNFKASAEQAAKDLEKSPVIAPVDGDKVVSGSTGEGGPTNRQQVIVQASAKWRSEPKLQSTTNVHAWTNQALRDAKMSVLTEQEKATL